MSPITTWKSPPSALHSFSITASIFRTNSSGQPRLGEPLSLRHLADSEQKKKKARQKHKHARAKSRKMFSPPSLRYRRRQTLKTHSGTLRWKLLQIQKKAAGTEEKFKSPSPVRTDPLTAMAGFEEIAAFQSAGSEGNIRQVMLFRISKGKYRHLVLRPPSGLPWS